MRKDKFEERDEVEVVDAHVQDISVTRERELPKLRREIDNVLKNYKGQAIAIVIMNEDAEGLPRDATMMMGGVTRPESQVAMSKALHNASTKAIDILIEGAQGNPRALAQLARVLQQEIKKEK